MKKKFSRLFAMLLLFVFCFSAFSYCTPVLAADPTPTPGTSTGIFGDDYVQVGEDGTVSIGNDSSDDMNMGDVVTKYKKVATVITGILTITMLILMIIQFTKLGAAGDNDGARKKAIAGILTTGIATALLGGATIIIGFFWNFLNGV